MASTGSNRHVGVLKCAAIGLLALTSFVLCLDSYPGTDPSSEYSRSHQNVLRGPDIEKSQYSAGKTLQIPLQRRLVEYSGRYYFIKVSVGSPGQSLELLVDTGSTDTWVYDNSYCDDNSKDNHFQCYDPKKSTTSEVMPAPPYFEPRYPGLKFQGVYVKDEFTVGSGRLKRAEFGMIQKGKGPTGGGIMGLGFDTAEFGPNNTFGYLYPDVLDTFYNESVIDSRAFGLYLGNGSVKDAEARGSLVLGGFDKSRFTDALVSFAIESPSDVRRVGIPLAAITATISGVSVPIWTAVSDSSVSDQSIPAVLDSGDMMAQVPVQAHAMLVEHLNRYSSGMLKTPKSGEAFDARMECRHSSADISINFAFIGLETSLTINVPFSELVLPSPWGQGCMFALQPKPKVKNKPYWLNLGSSIVGSMYLIVEYDKNSLQVARAQYDGRKADIVPINHRSEKSFG